MAAEAESGEASGQRWFSRGVGGIGGASLLADLGHEVPTSLLPSLLTSVLRAPASALGLIEGPGTLASVAMAGHPDHRRSLPDTMLTIYRVAPSSASLASRTAVARLGIAVASAALIRP